MYWKNDLMYLLLACTLCLKGAEVATIQFDRRCVSNATCLHIHYNVRVWVSLCISREGSIRQIDRYTDRCSVRTETPSLSPFPGSVCELCEHTQIHRYCTSTICQPILLFSITHTHSCQTSSCCAIGGGSKVVPNITSNPLCSF